MARPDIRLDRDEIEMLLEDVRNLQVATNGPGGFPHLTTLWFFVDDGAVTFRSFTKSQRIVNLRRDPRITVLAETGTDYQELRGVMIQGHAHLNTDPEEVLRVYAEVSRKMLGVDAVDLDGARATHGRFAGKNTVVRVEPLEMISWDHRKLDGGY